MNIEEITERLGEVIPDMDRVVSVKHAGYSNHLDYLDRIVSRFSNFDVEWDDGSSCSIGIIVYEGRQGVDEEADGL